MDVINRPTKSFEIYNIQYNSNKKGDGENMEDRNVLERGKAVGICGDLKGKISLQVFFVGLRGYSWSDNDKKARQNDLNQALNFICRKAIDEGVSLSFSQVTYSLDLDLYPYDYPSPLEFENAIGDKLKSIYINASSNGKLPGQKSQTAVLFFMNFDQGRNVASMTQSLGVHDFEFVMLYPDKYFPVSTIIHELLHLFGALDFYYPNLLYTLASASFPRSVMRTRCIAPEIDNLTKYLIGWHIKPTGDAQLILDLMKDLSLEDIRQERLRQDNTDNTVINTEYGTYYGPVRGSLPAGQGKLVFKSGTVYEGGFYQNRFNGQGKVIFSSGDTLIGDFKDNMGQGILYHAGGIAGKAEYSLQEIELQSGELYFGELFNKKPHGYGRILNKISGVLYIGTFQNGLMHGRGMVRMADYSAFECVTDMGNVKEMNRINY